MGFLSQTSSLAGSQSLADYEIRPQASGRLSVRRRDDPPIFIIILAGQLRAIDSLLGSVPPAEHIVLDFDPIVGPNATPPSPAASDQYAWRLYDWQDKIKFQGIRSIARTYVWAYSFVLRGAVYHENVRGCRWAGEVACPSGRLIEVLPDLDQMLDTNLAAHFHTKWRLVKPFPFLKLPTELRLQVYEHLLPRDTHLSLFDQPHRYHQPPRKYFAIQRTCRQLHAEATKYFYTNHTLFLKVVRSDDAHDTTRQPLRLAQLKRARTTILSVPPYLRRYFQKLEIQVDYTYGHWEVEDGKDDAENILNALLTLLPELKSMLISFPPHGSSSNSTREYTDRKNAVLWLLNHTPPPVQLLWDFTDWHDSDGVGMVTEIMNKRGGVQLGSSVCRVRCPDCEAIAAVVNQIHSDPIES